MEDEMIHVFMFTTLGLTHVNLVKLPAHLITSFSMFHVKNEDET